MFIYCICTQYLVGAPFALITASIRRGIEVISLWHCWGGMEAQVSLTVAFQLICIFWSLVSHFPLDNTRSGEFAASQAHQHHGHLNMTRSRKYDHITPILQSLHWLPIKYHISYKILSLAYKALNGLAPAYLTSLLSRYNPSRSLRSQNSGLLVVPRVQVQDLFVTYTIIQRVLTSSEMWVRSAPWTVQYYRKQHKEVYINEMNKKK